MYKYAFTYDTYIIFTYNTYNIFTSKYVNIVCIQYKYSIHIYKSCIYIL